MKLSHPLLLAALMALACGAQAGRGHHRDGSDLRADAAGQFDYYAVALSWSPSYCAKRNDPGQCASGRQLGFVLHGLWPQYVNGYPQNCSTDTLPADVRAKYSGLFPSPGLIGHEWPKHGTCSGLEPAAYFELSAKLKNQINIPAPYQRPAAPVRVSSADFIDAFKAANPAMARDAVLPFCNDGGRFLQEIHVCYDKGGASRSCGAREIKRSRSSCGQDSFLLQSVR